MRYGALILAALALAANGQPNSDQVEPDTADVASDSEFVGRYNGNSFETAMGMEIAADGTFRWGLSVGGLDLRAQGTWMQDGDRIFLTSDPKPVPAEFRWKGTEKNEDGPWVKVVRASNGKPFQYASLSAECKNGEQVFGQVYRDGWPSKERYANEELHEGEELPFAKCDEPETITFRLSSYNIKSETHSLRELGWKPGETAVFEFESNDLGVADFSGVTGYLEDGVIKLSGGEWPLELRKMPAPSEQTEEP
ncbi:hypothetical protein [Erythrobacter crassostreae]|uniref:Uncharacterized protein n=1 Tax=Erythrobacter crassostreae TaxID=2828328 RepID=A0A9X1F285_9SPHN|nr:hypothetical protein [Erythrobacter crassostrea]MBV7258752.1 hypothetical protein [Erythrobacter crassostrea]